MTDRRLGNVAAAAYVGVAASTWRAYVARGQAPGPDGKDEGFGRDYWLESTLKTWKDSRPGPGARTDLSNGE
jgi:hypothetical protein